MRENIYNMNEQIICNAGQVLIKEGDKDNRLFILESGTLEIRKGDKVITIMDTPASIIGEISVILEKPRTCSVVAKTDCQLSLVGNSINEIVESSPRMTKLIMNELAERLEQTTNKYNTIADRFIQAGTKDIE